MPTLFFSDISTKRRLGLIYSADVLYTLRISSRNNFSPKSHQAATSKLFSLAHDRTLCAQRLSFFFLTRITRRIFIETDLRLHANTGRKNQLYLIYPNLGSFFYPSTKQDTRFFTIAQHIHHFDVILLLSTWKPRSTLSPTNDIYNKTSTLQIKTLVQYPWQRGRVYATQSYIVKQMSNVIIRWEFHKYESTDYAENKLKNNLWCRYKG